MSLSEGKIRYETPFPTGQHGFTSGVDYWIAQNGSRSRTFRIDVRPTASIEITSLQYQFPAYTGLPEEVVENGGDIRAVEGTDVRISIRSTLPLQRVDLVFGDHSANNFVEAVEMRKSGGTATEATTTIPLELDPQRTTATAIRYFSFRATDNEGYESRRSGVFRLEVLPDKPPVVQWADADFQPEDDTQLDLPLNGSLELPIQAEDIDFALRYLRFHVKCGNKRIRPVELLESSATGATGHKGLINRKVVFSPSASRLVEGDTAEIWAEAVDTKFPKPNSASTQRMTIRVVAPQKQEPPEEKRDDAENRSNNEEYKKTQEQNKNGNEDKNNQPTDEQGVEQNGKQDNNPSKETENDNKDGQTKGEKNEEKQGDKQGKEFETDNSSKKTSNEMGKERPSADKKFDNNDSKRDNSNNGFSKQENGDQLLDNSKDGETDEQEKSKSGRQQSVGNRKKPINPDTQDGDAMEEIIRQMKKEGKFDDKKLDELSSGTRSESTPEPEQGLLESGSKNNGDKTQQTASQPDAEKQGGNKQGNSQPDGNNNGRNNDKSNNQNGGNDSGERQPDQRRNNGGNNSQSNNDAQQSNPNPKSPQQSHHNPNDQNANKESELESASHNVPADPAGKTTQQQDNSFNPNSGEQLNQGNGSNQPKESGGDVPDDSDLGGDKGKERGTNQPEQDSQTQSVDRGESDGREGSGEGNSKRKPVEFGSSEKNQQGSQQEDQQKNPRGQMEKQNQSDQTGGRQQGQSESQPGKQNQFGHAEENRQEQSEQSGSFEESGESEKQSGQSKQPEQNQISSNSDEKSGRISDTNQPFDGEIRPSVSHVAVQPEDPNLEYAQKVTNLVLEHLEDELKTKPSRELLNNLGWTEKELRDFHRKWKSMSEQSRHSRIGNADNDSWKEAFKSLGLRPARDRQQLQKSHDSDDGGNVAESQRFAPPPAVKDRFKRYAEGIGK
jgi:hypothetical protein